MLLMPPLFLSLDGLDGCGKSTQCRLLADWLRGRGHTVTPCIDPGGTDLGQQLRRLLLHQQRQRDPRCEALLFMASRAQLLCEVIRPALQAGHIVLSDRYLLSTVVYQGHAGGLDPAMLWQVGLFASAGLEPERTLVLDLPLEQAQARRRRPADAIERRGDAYHLRVREGFLSEARRRPERVHVIDASASVDAVQQAIREDIAPLLSS
jgi:dTMP kinase